MAQGLASGYPVQEASRRLPLRGGQLFRPHLDKILVQTKDKRRPCPAQFVSRNRRVSFGLPFVVANSTNSEPGLTTNASLGTIPNRDIGGHSSTLVHREIPSAGEGSKIARPSFRRHDLPAMPETPVGGRLAYFLPECYRTTMDE